LCDVVSQNVSRSVIWALGRIDRRPESVEPWIFRLCHDSPKGAATLLYILLSRYYFSLWLCSQPHHSTIPSPFRCVVMPRDPASKYDNGHYYSNNQNSAPYPQSQGGAAAAGGGYMDPQQIVPVIQDPVSKKKHVCPTCDRTFTTSGHLARHARVHTGEKNHQCPFPNCKTRCSRQDNLQQQ